MFKETQLVIVRREIMYFHAPEKEGSSYKLNFSSFINKALL